MTETRKQIIEIIEPYMSKELSEGCLFKKDCIYPKTGKPIKQIFSALSVVRDRSFIEGVYFAVDNSETEPPNVYIIFPESENNNEGFEILGHYDITALDNYIDSLGFDIYTHNGVKGIHKNNKTLFILQNKPLHLFSTTEEKELLELLLKLK